MEIQICSNLFTYFAGACCNDAVVITSMNCLLLVICQLHETRIEFSRCFVEREACGSLVSSALIISIIPICVEQSKKMYNWWSPFYERSDYILQSRESACDYQHSLPRNLYCRITLHMSLDNRSPNNIQYIYFYELIYAILITFIRCRRYTVNGLKNCVLNAPFHKTLGTLNTNVKQHRL